MNILGRDPEMRGFCLSCIHLSTYHIGFLTLLAFTHSCLSPRPPPPDVPAAMYTPTSHPPSLSDLHCTCLHLSTLSSSPCASSPTTPLTWPAAYSLATKHNIALHFATRTTIARLLAMPSPLPTSVLQVAQRGPAAVALEGWKDEVVCGFGSGSGGRRDGASGEETQQPGFVALVVAWLMVLVVVYLVGEWVVARLRARPRGVSLGGAEKRLRV